MVDQPKGVLLEIVEMERHSICIGKPSRTPNVELKVEINRATGGEKFEDACEVCQLSQHDGNW